MEETINHSENIFSLLESFCNKDITFWRNGAPHTVTVVGYTPMDNEFLMHIYFKEDKTLMHYPFSHMYEELGIAVKEE